MYIAYLGCPNNFRTFRLQTTERMVLESTVFLLFSSYFEIYQKHINYKRKAVFITEELQEILGSFDSAQIIWYKASKEKSHDSTCTNLLSFDVVLHFIFDLHFTFGLLIEYLVLMDILCWDYFKVIISFLFCLLISS